MGIKSRSNKKDLFTVATFNVRGLTKETKQSALSNDIDKFNIDVCCLQETKVTKHCDKNVSKGNRLITIQSNSPHYGNGFILNKRWKNSIHRYWKVSDRICVLQLKTKKSRKRNPLDKNLIDHVITIVNVYAPTTKRAITHPNEVRDMYIDLTNLQNEFKKLSTSVVILAGDFNGKVGPSEENESCIGKWTRGVRNENGQKLVEWCESNHKKICNTSFQHKQSHIATWSRSIIDRETNQTKQIYNQIDYIIMDKIQAQSMTDARSYSNTETDSDHRIVVTRFQLQWSKIYHQKTKQKTTTTYHTNLLMNLDIRERYQQNLTDKLETLDTNQSVTLPNIKEVIKKSASECLGFKKQNYGGHVTDDNQLQQMSQQQKQIHQILRNTKNPTKVIELKRKRNNILKNMTKRLKDIKEEQIDTILTELENVNDDQKMFKAVKKLHQKPYENPTLCDNKGKIITDPQEIYNMIQKHFKNHFNKQNIEEIITHTE